MADARIRVKRTDKEDTRKNSSVLLDYGQPLYVKDSNHLYVGDGTTQAKDLKYINQTEITELSNSKLAKATGTTADKARVVYANGSDGNPTTAIKFDQVNASGGTIVRRTVDGAAVASNIGTPFNDITKLGDNLGKRLVYVGGDKTLSSLNKITISSTTYDVDFNGATITVNQNAVLLAADTKDGLIKGHSHCVIRNLNLVVNITPWSTNPSVTGYNVLDRFGGVENVLITINSEYASSTQESVTIRGIANADHISNTKVQLDCSTQFATAICFSYCNYLLWCRADGTNNYRFAECNYLTNCFSMVKDQTQTPYRTHAFLNCGTLSNCSYYEYVAEGSKGWIEQYTSTVGKNSLDIIQTENKSTEVSKAYVSPSGGSGIARVDIDPEPTTSETGNIPRRLPGGQIRATAAVASADCMIKNQFQVMSQTSYNALSTKDPNTFYFIINVV